MKTFTQLRTLFVAALALSLLNGCVPIEMDKAEVSIDGHKSAATQPAADPPIPRSPLPEGESPAHRQNRRAAPPSPDQRMGGTPRQSSESECEAAEVITSDGPALVFKHLGALEANLPLNSVLAALSMSNGGLGTQVEQEDIIQSMVDSFSASQMINSLSGAVVNVSARPLESVMDPAAFIEQMRPTAAFNRLDLAAQDGSVCGEQRIIFELGSPFPGQTTTPINGQFTLIFEARYPNPLLHSLNQINGLIPTGDISDCKAVAEFWASLVDLPDDNARGIAVADFFLAGTTMPDGTFLPPVVHFANYQSPLGQIRTNQFVDSPWQLREFRTDVSSGNVAMIPDTNKGNPVTDLYNANSTFSIDNPALRVSFLNELSAQMDLLLTPEINGLTAVEEVLTSFEPAFDDQFSNFTSNSQGSADNPSQQATTDVRTLINNAIQSRITNNTLPPSTTVNDDQILNRLGAMTCGGCHQFSGGFPNNEISDTVNWPVLGAAGPFTHVRNTGGVEAALSTGLTATFLPLRRQFLLDTWLCDDVTPGCQTDDDCDDGLICVAGECVEENIEPGCVTDADCPYGQVCEYGECVTPQSTNACDEVVADFESEIHVRGNSADAGANFQGSCGGNGVEEVVAFTPIEGDTYCITTRGSRIDTVLYVRSGICESPRTELACSRSNHRQLTTRSAAQSRRPYVQVEVTLESADAYFIFVDTARGGGAWQLNITQGPCGSLDDPRDVGPRDASSDRELEDATDGTQDPSTTDREDKPIQPDTSDRSELNASDVETETQSDDSDRFETESDTRLEGTETHDDENADTRTN